MSRQLDQIVADAASKNLGFAQALETLTTLELEARNTRAIERRFRTSRLHAQYSIDSFLVSAKPSWPRSSVGAPAKPISASYSLLPWTC